MQPMNQIVIIWIGNLLVCKSIYDSAYVWWINPPKLWKNKAYIAFQKKCVSSAYIHLHQNIVNSV